MDILFIELINVALLIESAFLYFLFDNKFKLLFMNWEKSIKEKYIFHIFSSILDFISSDEIVEESLISVTIANSPIFDYSKFRKSLEEKIKTEKDKIIKISKGIEEMEKIEEGMEQMSSYAQNSKYLNFGILPFPIIALFLPHNVSNVLLGISLGLETISLYFIVYSYFVYRHIINKISSYSK